MAPSEGSFQVTLNYANDHGPINTGITATAKQLQVRCDGSGVQNIPIVMPHSVGIQLSTTGMFSAHAGAHCSFELQQGFNMSFLSHFAHYTSGQGGMDGPRNDARIGDLLITPMNATAIKTASKQP